MLAAWSIGLGVLAPPGGAQFVQIDSARIPAEEFRWQIEQLDPSPPLREAMEIAYARYAEEYDAARRVHDSLDRWIWSSTEGDDRWYGGLPRDEFRETVVVEYQSNDRRWEEAWREIETHYFERLSSIAPSREDMLESFKRKRLRFREFNDNRVYEDRGWEVDLADITVSVSKSLLDDPDVAASLLDYELGLHRVLLDLESFRREREAQMQRIRDRMEAARVTGAEDAEALADRSRLFVKGSELTFQLRSVQQAGAKRILMSVSDPANRVDLEEAFYVALWAMLFEERSLTPETAFNEALARRDLSAAQRAQVLAVRGAYRDERRRAMADFEQTYLDQFSAALHEQYWRLWSAGEREAANAVFEPPRAQWTNQREKWIGACGKFMERLRAILAEQPAETSP